VLQGWGALHYEIRQSKVWLDSVIIDSAYECKTFAYPFHEHDLREMIALRDSVGYIAARDGGKWRDRPFGGNEGNDIWDTLNLYEVPLEAWGSRLCGSYNSFTEEHTRDTIRAYIARWKENNTWANFYTHGTTGQSSCDTLHLKWILDELQQDGDVWVETFGTIVEYVRNTHYTEDG